MVHWVGLERAAGVQMRRVDVRRSGRISREMVNAGIGEPTGDAVVEVRPVHHVPVGLKSDT